MFFIFSSVMHLCAEKMRKRLAALCYAIFVKAMFLNHRVLSFGGAHVMKSRFYVHGKHRGIKRLVKKSS